MAKIYYQKITTGKMTYREVPALFKEPTKAYFKDRVADGTITSVQYEQFIGEPYEP